MTPMQVAKQLRYLLRASAWTDSPSELIVGSSVYITSGVVDDDDLPVRMPFALIAVGQGRSDRDDPDLIEQEFSLVVAVSIHGDPLGENALIGGPGAASGRFGKSDGRGILDLESALLATVGRLTGSSGTPVICSEQASPDPQRVGEDTHVVWRKYTLTALCTRRDEYQGPQNLAVNVAVAGQAALSWDLPPDSYSRRAMVVRRASGSTAPSSATAGTGVTLSGALATSVTVTGLSAGAHSFAVFAGHTESGANENEKFSEQVAGTYVSGTVT